MGKRGPAQTPLSVLEKRGSWLAKARKKKQQQRKTRRPNSQKVVAAKVLSSKKIRTGIPGYDPAVGADKYRFSYSKAKKAINFFHSKLRHVKGEKTRQPFILEPWEQAIIGNLFGWVHKKNSLRRYREAFIMVGRKNGKTPLAAGIILYLLFEDGEPGAEIYGAASEYKQASLVFAHAWGMVNQEQSLRDRAHIFKGQAKAIEVGEPGEGDYGIYRVISSDAFSAHGFNTHAAVVDELHTQPNSDLVDALLTSVGARRQPLVIYITTQDFEREGSICNAKEDYAVRVRDKTINDVSFLPVIYQASKEDDWTKVSTWKRANPNLGVSVSLEYLKRECKRAQEIPACENIFKRLHLNIRTEQSVRWLPMDDWDACNAIILPEGLVGCDCFAGLDLSSTRDITALALWFPVEFALLLYFWIPKDNAHLREHRDRVPYTVWARDGFIKMTPGNVIDYEVVMSDIQSIGELYNIQAMGFDRWNFEALRQRLIAEGFPEDNMIAFGQGFASMSAPSKELEKLVLSHKLGHGHNPVLRWMAANTAAATDPAGNIKPDKKRSGEKIDGIVATIEALGVALTVPQTIDRDQNLLEVGI